MTERQAKEKAIIIARKWRKMSGAVDGQSLMDVLVSVQPMTLPLGNLFYMDFVHGDDSWWDKFKRDLKYWCYLLRHPSRIPWRYYLGELKLYWAGNRTDVFADPW